MNQPDTALKWVPNSNWAHSMIHWRQTPLSSFLPPPPSPPPPTPTPHPPPRTKALTQQHTDCSRWKQWLVKKHWHGQQQPPPGCGGEGGVGGGRAYICAPDKVSQAHSAFTPKHFYLAPVGTGRNACVRLACRCWFPSEKRLHSLAAVTETSTKVGC